MSTEQGASLIQPRQRTSVRAPVERLHLFPLVRRNSKRASKKRKRKRKIRQAQKKETKKITKKIVKTRTKKTNLNGIRRKRRKRH